jgi:hypothetical protein
MCIDIDETPTTNLGGVPIMEAAKKPGRPKFRSDSDKTLFVKIPHSLKRKLKAAGPNMRDLVVQILDNHFKNIGETREN